METGEFDALYDASHARLVHQIHAMTGDRDGAEESVQEAFARAWARRRTFAEVHNPEAWLRTVAYRLAVSRWRSLSRSRRTADRALEPERFSPGPDENHVALMAALDRLPDRPAAGAGPAPPVRPQRRAGRRRGRCPGGHRQGPPLPRAHRPAAAAHRQRHGRGSLPCLTSSTTPSPTSATSRPPSAPPPPPGTAATTSAAAYGGRGRRQRARRGPDRRGRGLEPGRRAEHRAGPGRAVPERGGPDPVRARPSEPAPSPTGTPDDDPTPGPGQATRTAIAPDFPLARRLARGRPGGASRCGDRRRDLRRLRPAASSAGRSVDLQPSGGVEQLGARQIGHHPRRRPAARHLPECRRGRGRARARRRRAGPVPARPGAPRTTRRCS